MRNLMALDVREWASPEAAAANFRDRTRRASAQSRDAAQAAGAWRRSTVVASETVTMIVVLVAWAVIAAYMFGHAVEGMLDADTAPVTAVAAPAAARTEA
jgi:hypothetical protein